MSKPPIDSDEAVRKPHEIARVDALRDHNHTMAQKDSDSPSLENGRIALSYKNPNDSLSARKKKDEKAIRFALKMINLVNQLVAIDMRLSEIYQMQQGINRQLKAIQQGNGVELDSNGKLQDKDAEKALQEYEKKHGVKVDRTNTEAVYQSLLLYNQELNAENHRLTQERDEVQHQLDNLSKEQNPPTKEVNSLLSKAWELKGQQTEFQNHNAIEDKAEYEHQAATISRSLSLHDEIRNFMQEFAKARKSGDPNDRLLREKEMVQELSAEAKEQLSMAKGVEHIFKSDYFDPLNNEESVVGQEKSGQVPSFNV